MPRLQLDRISQRETAGPAGPQNLSRACSKCGGKGRILANKNLIRWAAQGVSNMQPNEYPFKKVP
jgi:hypothetical protein